MTIETRAQFYGLQVMQTCPNIPFIVHSSLLVDCLCLQLHTTPKIHTLILKFLSKESHELILSLTSQPSIQQYLSCPDSPCHVVIHQQVLRKAGSAGTHPLYRLSPSMNANVPQQESLRAQEHSTLSKQSKPPVYSTLREVVVCTDLCTVDSLIAYHVQFRLEKPLATSELCSFEVQRRCKAFCTIYTQRLLCFILDGISLLFVPLYVTLH